MVVKSACGAVPGLLPVRAPGRSPNPPCRSLLSRLITVLALRVSKIRRRSRKPATLHRRVIHLALAGAVHIGRADGLRRRALRPQERVGYPVAESQQAGSGQCCREGAAPPDGVG